MVIKCSYTMATVIPKKTPAKKAAKGKKVAEPAPSPVVSDLIPDLENIMADGIAMDNFMTKLQSGMSNPENTKAKAEPAPP